MPHLFRFLLLLLMERTSPAANGGQQSSGGRLQLGLSHLGSLLLLQL
jgi:hypothetical protein